MSRPLTVALMTLAIAICVGAVLQAVRGSEAKEARVALPGTSVAAAGSGFTRLAGDIVLGAVAAVLATVGLLETQRLSARAGEFPALLAGTLAVLGILIAVRAVRARAEAQEHPFAGVPWRHLLPVIAMLVALALSVSRVGFYEAAMVFAGATYWLLAPASPPGEGPLRRVAQAGGFAVLLVAAVYLAFRLVLEIPTPAGLLI
jgi:hypothetical protein